MTVEVERSRSGPPVLRRVGAGLVLIVAAVLAIHFVIGLIMTVFWIVVAVAAIAGIIWALKTI